MIVLVALTERFVGRHPATFSGMQSNSWRFSAEAVARCPRDLDVLCLGDSQVKVGVLPRVLEAKLGGRACNLAAFGGQAPSSFFLLRRILESGARPRAVVVDFDPNLLAVSPRSSAPFWGELVDAHDAAELAWNARDLALANQGALAWALPSFKGRSEIRAHILAILRRQSDPGAEERRATLRNWSANGGAHVASRANAPRPVVDTRVGPAKTWRPNRANALYLERFLHLARVHDIAVYWLIPPKSAEWQLRREHLGSDVAFAALVRSHQEQYSNLVVIDGRTAGYAEDCFLDPTHLNRRGAMEFSAAVAEIIAGGQPSSQASLRWVALPAFQGRDAGPVVEDLAESRLALRALSATR
ncbi:MAG: hypothetical protein P4L84_29105 [Isosphaeraceae bacterium]|nr:hypothetical protein [Isosphaeraceae bacterium]